MNRAICGAADGSLQRMLRQTDERMTDSRHCYPIIRFAKHPLKIFIRAIWTA